MAERDGTDNEFRFSLRTFFFVVTLICVAFAVFPRDTIFGLSGFLIFEFACFFVFFAVLHAVRNRGKPGFYRLLLAMTGLAILLFASSYLWFLVDVDAWTITRNANLIDNFDSKNYVGQTAEWLRNEFGPPREVSPVRKDANQGEWDYQLPTKYKVYYPTGHATLFTTMKFQMADGRVVSANAYPPPHDFSWP